MMFATMSQDHSNGKHGRLRALAIHGLVVYQNTIGGKSQEVESLIVSGGETAQFQGTGMLERLVRSMCSTESRGTGWMQTSDFIGSQDKLICARCLEALWCNQSVKKTTFEMDINNGFHSVQK